MQNIKNKSDFNQFKYNPSISLPSLSLAVHVAQFMPELLLCVLADSAKFTPSVVLIVKFLVLPSTR